MIFGIDSASVAGNKNPDWVKAKAAGPINFALIRSNFGTKPDAAFARDWPKLKAAGLVRGAYMFLRFPREGKAVPTPEAQVQVALDTIGDLEDDDLPPTVDVEFPGKGRIETGLSIGECLEGVRAAWGALKDNYGVAPIVYTSGRVWRDDLGNADTPDLIESPLWLSRYPFKNGRPAMRDAAFFADGKHDPPVPTPWGDATNWWIHQYQGDATQFPGFTGKVDMNRFNPLFRGGRGERVRWVQRRLGLAETGKFDDAMADAVRGFQDDRDLVSDGIVGPRTFAYLARVEI